VRLSFAVIAGAGTYSEAHYPIHAFAEFEHQDRRLIAHPILVVETKLFNPPRIPPFPEWKPVEVAGHGALGLWHLPVRRLEAQIVPRERLPSATGSAVPDHSGATVLTLRVRRGQWPEALGMRLGPRGRYVGGVGQSMNVSPLPDLGERPLGMIWGHYAQAAPTRWC
jgi:hypothetical protein